MSAQYQLPREVREQIAKDIADAKPATPGLLVQLADSARQVREHDHATQREDFFCLNQTSWAGGRIAPVLRRLLDADAEVDRKRAALSEACDQIAELEARVAELEAELVSVRSSVDRVRAVHEQLGGTGEDAFCYVCSNHGDIDWPCRTVAAIDNTPYRCTLHGDACDGDLTQAHIMQPAPKAGER